MAKVLVLLDIILDRLINPTPQQYVPFRTPCRRLCIVVFYIHISYRHVALNIDRLPLLSTQAQKQPTDRITRKLDFLT